MTDSADGNNGGNDIIHDDSGRSLPTTSTSTPMPEVKLQKETNGCGAGEGNEE